MFGLKSIIGYGVQAAKALLGFTAKSADDMLKGQAKKNFDILLAQKIAENGGKPIKKQLQKQLMVQAQELAEKSGAGLLKKSMTAGAVTLGIGGAGLGVDAAIRGKKSIASSALDGIMEAARIPDAANDTKSFFERIKEFFRQVFEFIADPRGYLYGKPTGQVLDEHFRKHLDFLKVDPTKPSGPDGNLLQQTKDYADGLWKDATPSVSGSVNVIHAAAHGATHGVGLVGSFAYANTIGWLTGQSTQEVHKEYVGSAIDSGWKSTTGLPDLNGHWAHAANNIASFAAPGGAALKAGMRLSRAFNTTNRVANAGLKVGPQVVAPMGPGM